jgi:hypothetical protein
MRVSLGWIKMKKNNHRNILLISITTPLRKYAKSQLKEQHRKKNFYNFYLL